MIFRKFLKTKYVLSTFESEWCSSDGGCRKKIVYLSHILTFVLIVYILYRWVFFILLFVFSFVESSSILFDDFRGWTDINPLYIVNLSLDYFNILRLFKKIYLYYLHSQI